MLSIPAEMIATGTLTRMPSTSGLYSRLNQSRLEMANALPVKLRNLPVEKLFLDNYDSYINHGLVKLPHIGRTDLLVSLEIFDHLRPHLRRSDLLSNMQSTGRNAYSYSLLRALRTRTFAATHAKRLRRASASGVRRSYFGTITTNCRDEMSVRRSHRNRYNYSTWKKFGRKWSAQTSYQMLGVTA